MEELDLEQNFRTVVLLQEKHRKIIKEAASRVRWMAKERNLSPMLRIIIEQWAEDHLEGYNGHTDLV